MKSLLGFLVFPFLAQQGVRFYAKENERALDQQYASEIRRQSKPVDSPATDAYVKRIGGALVAQLNDAPFYCQFELISGGNWTEPFSPPGGYVFIPARAFVAAQDEAEFVGMLAHSVGHVVLGYWTRTDTRGQTASFANLLLVFVGGWHADSERPETLVPAVLLESQRIYELEADRFPAAFHAGFSERLPKHSSDQKILRLAVDRMGLRGVADHQSDHLESTCMLELSVRPFGP